MSLGAAGIGLKAPYTTTRLSRFSRRLEDCTGSPVSTCEVMMHDKTALARNVRQVMADVFDVDESELPEDVSAENMPQWTSLEHLTLIVALEARFGTTFSTNEMGSMTSLDQ